MKTTSAGMDTHLALSRTNLVTCFKLKRLDGVIHAFTEHDQPIPFDLGDGDGSQTYVANTAYNRSAIQTTHDLKVDNLDIEAVFDSAALTVENMRAGIYDFAEIKIFLINWLDPAGDGAIKLRRGTIGQVSARDEMFVAELRGLIQSYMMQLVDLATPDCRADLGDAGHVFGPNQTQCKIQLLPPIWEAAVEALVRPARDGAAPPVGSPTQFNVVRPTTFNDRHFKCTTPGVTAIGSPDFTEPPWNLTIGGSTIDGDQVIWETIRALTIEGEVSGVVDNREFNINYTGDAPDSLFTGGLLKFEPAGSPAGGGNNAGLKQEIKEFGPSPAFVKLFLPMPFNIQIGDAFTITAGCDKVRPTCRDTFDNIHNIRAEPDVPGNDLVFKTPDAPG